MLQCFATKTSKNKKKVTFIFKMRYTKKPVRFRGLTICIWFPKLIRVNGKIKKHYIHTFALFSLQSFPGTRKG